ncbi:MAG: hypothetical protein Q9227_001579 [Pyrenula ochraceoflavens]
MGVRAAFTAFFLAALLPAISAKSFLNNDLLHRRHLDLDHALRREASIALNAEIFPRDPEPQDSAPAASGTPGPSNDINFNTPQWNTTTFAACTKALGQVTKTSNSLGMLGCYNVPFLDTNTGVFEADLRLYQIAPASGPFTGVASRDISVGLSYSIASVTSATNSVKRDINVIEMRQTTSNGVMSELQQFQFIGQINKTLSLSKITRNQVQSLVIPTVQLSAKSPMTGAPMMTNLTSADTTYFVNGNFADTPGTGPAAAAPTAIAAAVQTASAFVLPGTTFGIFPLGFIITGAWTVLFVSAVAYGTYGRIRFRQAYRRRKATAVAGGRPI